MVRLRLGALLLLALAAPLSAAVKPAPIFGKGMVLQREVPIPIWGTAAPGEQVTVTLLDQKKVTTADKDGKWKVILDKLTAGGPYQVTVEGKNKLTFDDVLIGDVWLCSGQSNMAWRLSQSENAKEEAKTANHPKIRFNAGAAWVPCTPESALNFSACGYYFGRDLHAKLNVPIGLINRSVGGTSARLWTSIPAIDGEPELKPFAEAIKQVDPKSKRGTAGTLYERLIAPLVPLALRGVIWYQGESDAGRPAEYAALFPTLIRSWRKAFDQDLPFLFVQLAPIGGRNGWELLRETQFDTLKKVPKTGMAVIIDGDTGIHPLKKQLPGSRLALAARAVAYGEKLIHSGPVFKAIKIEEDKAILTFENTGGGLAFKGDKAVGFTILGADGKAVPAEAKIEGETVVVRSKEVAKPTAVRYGWSNDPKCNLFNKEGLPAVPFRTDRKAQ